MRCLQTIPMIVSVFLNASLGLRQQNPPTRKTFRFPNHVQFQKDPSPSLRMTPLPVFRVILSEAKNLHFISSRNREEPYSQLYPRLRAGQARSLSASGSLRFQVPRRKTNTVIAMPSSQETSSEEKIASGLPLGQASERVSAASR